MSTIIGLLVAILVVAAVLAAVYVIGVVLSAREQERRRRAELYQQQMTESRIQAASVRAIQQMFEVARQAQDAERHF